MIAMNLGSGPDIIPNGRGGFEWINVDDAYYLHTGNYYGKVEGWNAKFPPPDFYWNRFDFVLVNHVLCTMPYQDVTKVFQHVYKVLKPGGKVQVIDMDVLVAISDFVLNKGGNLPIQDGSPEWNLCMHLSGYSTRPSLFTPDVLTQFLSVAGFNNVTTLSESSYDLRPLESCIVEGIK